MPEISLGDAVRQIAALAEAGNVVRDVAGNPFAILPLGYAVHDLEKMRLTPQRKRGTTTLLNVESFCRFVQEHMDKDATHIYGQREPARFVAIFNDHAGKDTMGWQDHKAVYSCPLSPEWLRWVGSNGKKMPQVEFAQFIEDNAPDCSTPPSGEMIEIARSIEAKKAVNFASGVRLANGQNDLTYQEEISGTAAKGRLSIPEKFTINIPVFDGGQSYLIDARLRYRIPDGGGKLTMWYDLDRHHKILEHAVAAIAGTIENLTGLKPLSATV